MVTQNASKIYGAADPSPLTTANLSVFLAADTITATFSRTAGNTVGPYSITTTLVDPNNRLGNYVVTNAGATFTINTKPVTVTTQNASKTYGEADPTPLTTADLTVFVAGDGITASFSRAPGTDVGTVSHHHHPGRSQQQARELRRHQQWCDVHHQHQAGHGDHPERQQDLRRG